jgi:hypothetical protein
LHLLVAYLQGQTTSPHIDESKDLRPSHKIAAAFLQKAASKLDVRVRDPESPVVPRAVIQSDAPETPDSKSDGSELPAHPQTVVVAGSRSDVQGIPDNKLDVPDARRTAGAADKLDVPELAEVSQSDVSETPENRLDELVYPEVQHHQEVESQWGAPV